MNVRSLGPLCNHMDKTLFAASPSGRVTHTRTGIDAFVPNPLPPAIAWRADAVSALASASYALGELGVSFSASTIPHLGTHLLRRDAIASARIEGFHVTMEDILTAEATGVSAGRGIRLALNYIRTYEHARVRLKELPLSLRLMRELHEVLLDGIAETGSTPGHFRRSQNWIGPAGSTPASAIFVPPPVEEMNSLLDNWERYLHAESALPPLARLAMAHYQYAAIHPFLTMNESMGLIFAPLYLQHLSHKKFPAVFVGHFLQRQSAEFYYRMIEVCQHGTWEDWISFYLFGVADSARDTVTCLQRVHHLHTMSMNHVEAAHMDDDAARTLNMLFQHPIVSATTAADYLGVDCEAASRALACVESTGMVTRQGSLWVAGSLIAALQTLTAGVETYEPLF
ncbi:MAG: Fic family protein [Dehalococcoidia bacterium]|nr:Fic family protein [Dehalococcoidia bacterium]